MKKRPFLADKAGADLSALGGLMDGSLAYGMRVAVADHCAVVSSLLVRVFDITVDADENLWCAMMVTAEGERTRIPRACGVERLNECG